MRYCGFICSCSCGVVWVPNLPFKEFEQIATRFPNSISTSITSKVPDGFNIKIWHWANRFSSNWYWWTSMLSRQVFNSYQQTLYYCFVTREASWIWIPSCNNYWWWEVIYQCVDFARQYGLDVKDMLRRIVVSRAFTVYQLVALITKELSMPIT